MNRKTFEWCVRFFSENLAARYTLHFIYKILPLTLFIAYPSLLVYAFFWQRQNIRMLTIVPLGVFIAITILRYIVNEQRPYERYGKPSVFNKTTKGKKLSQPPHRKRVHYSNGVYVRQRAARYRGYGDLAFD